MAGNPMPRITGISGFTVQDPEATPEQMHGGPANPAHGNWGEQAQPYSWESQLTGFTGNSGPDGYQTPYITDENIAYLPAGDLSQDPFADNTPSVGQVGGSHAAPITRPLSGPLPSMADSINNQLIQSADAHASNLGASRNAQLSQDGVSFQQDNWLEDWSVSPGTSLQNPTLPGQLKSGIMFGTRSREQSFARQNEYGFDSPHLHRRTAQSPIPGNTMWMRPGSRPLVKSIPGVARPPIGQASPFYGDNPFQTFGTQGAVLTNTPAEYVAPPEPNLTSPLSDTNPSPEIALW